MLRERSNRCVFCSVLQCVAVCCNVLWVAVCCRVLQCAAVCCSVLQCAAVVKLCASVYLPARLRLCVVVFCTVWDVSCIHVDTHVFPLYLGTCMSLNMCFKLYE